jgi:hypothetical protein
MDMWNKKIIYTIMFFIFLSSCTPPPPHVKAGDAFILKFVNEAKQSYDLYLFGSGGAFLDDIKAFHFYFISFEKMEIDEARKLAVDLTENLLYQINSDSELQPYLHQTPFGYKDILISITFRDYEQSNYVNPPSIALLIISNNKIYYDVFNPFTDKLCDLHSESYQRAKGIVEHQESLRNLQECEKCK